METVKQMDSALQRRAKARQSSTAAATAAMSDSEKIALQVSLDVAAFGREVSSLLPGIDMNTLPAFRNLSAIVAEETKNASQP
jgi:hypothetical protein